MNAATATAKAALAKAKTAFQKIKPKFGESITIAGEPVYLDMPEDATKVHANRIYLENYYLPHEIITDDVKIVYKRFITEKKVASCEKVHLDILKKGLLHRLQTIEGEAAGLRESGDSISLRERLGHAQKLRDLLEIVEGEFRLCADRAAAEARRKAEEAAAAAAAAADNRPPPLTEDQIRTLVKKFAVLILHAKDPVETDRPRLNRPAKNLIAKLDAVPDMVNPEVDAFKSTHMSNPLLLRILELGQVGFESFDYTYTMNIYTKLLQEIISNFPEEFTQNLPADAEPHHKIFVILERMTEKVKEVERQLLACNTQAAGLQKRIEELGAQVVAAEKAVKQDPALVAERDTLKANLQTEHEELEKVRKEVEVLQGEKDACDAGMAAAAKAAREAAAVAAARIAELETGAKVSAARIAELEKAAGDAGTAKRAADEAAAAATAQVAGLQAQIASLEAGVPVAAGAAAAAVADIARLTSELEAATKQKADAAAAAALADAATDAARRALADEEAKHAATKTELEQVKAAIGVETAAKEGAVRDRDAAREEASKAAGAAAKTISELQASLAEAQAKVASAQEGIARITEQVAAKDAELAASREEKRKCDEALAAAGAGAAAAAGSASEEKAKLVTEAERLGGVVATIARERDALKAQQVEATAAGAAKTSDLEAARLAIAGLREQVAKYEADVKETKRVTDERIAELQRQLGEKGTEGTEAVARLQAQMEAARVASAAELDRQLKAQAAANKENVDKISALLAVSVADLTRLKDQMMVAEQNKGKLRDNLGVAARALNKKTQENAAALRAREAELLGKIGEGERALAAAQKAGQEALAKLTEESQAALRKKSAEMDQLLQTKTDEIARINAAATAAAAEAKRSSDAEIAKMRDLFDLRRAELEKKVAEAQIAVSQATGKAAKDIQAQVEAAQKEKQALLAAQAAAIAESEKKCAAAATAAAAAADVKIKAAVEDLRRQGEAMKEKEAGHAAQLSALEAKHKEGLAAAIAKAKADAEAEFAQRVKALGGEKESAIAAAIKGAQGAAAADLEAKLAAAAKAKNAAVTQATAETRAATVKEKDAEIAKIRQEGVAASAAAVEAAKKDAAATFKAQEAKLAGEKDAAIAAAVAKAREAKDAEFATKKAELAAAATAATAAAVAAATVAAGEKTAGEVAKARVEEAAKTTATDLETLKRLATQVLAGQAKWASYPGAEKNAALGQLLAKMDGRMSDICALVYFVSYFLNKMIRPSLQGSISSRSNDTKHVETLVSSVKELVNRLATTPDRLFELLMTIEPALLLSNKIIPRGDESYMHTMNYLITQKTDTRMFKELILAASKSIATNIAWRVVRNGKDTAESMRFVTTENPKQILFMHRPEVDPKNKEGLADAALKKTYMRTYSESGASGFVLSPLPATKADGALQAVINAEDARQNYVTYDVLFLVFLYASKKYIIDNKESVPCTIPSEIINNSILKDSMFEGQAPKPAAQAPAAQAAPKPQPKCVPTEIRRMDKGTTANVIILSEEHPTIFAADPYCFLEGGMPLPSKVELSYIEFQKALDGVVARSCSGQNPKQFQIPPGFRRDGIKDKIIPMDSKFAVSATFFDLTNYKGLPAGAFFKCTKPTSAAPGAWVSPGSGAGSKPAADLVLEDLTPSSPTVKIDYAKSAAVAAAEAKGSKVLDQAMKGKLTILLSDVMAKTYSAPPFSIVGPNGQPLQPSGRNRAGQFIQNPYDYASFQKFVMDVRRTNPAVSLPGYVSDSTGTRIRGEPNSTGMYDMTAIKLGGRRTQKKRAKNSKKFTQRKRWQ